HRMFFALNCTFVLLQTQVTLMTKPIAMSLIAIGLFVFLWLHPIQSHPLQQSNGAVKGRPRGDKATPIAVVATMYVGGALIQSGNNLEFVFSPTKLSINTGYHSIYIFLADAAVASTVV